MESGKRIRFHIKHELILPPSGDWYILPFVDIEYARLIYSYHPIKDFSAIRSSVVNSDNKIVIQRNNQQVSYTVTHVRMSDISSITIY